MNALLSINHAQFVGPPVSLQEIRDRYFHRLNETCSLTDQVFEKTVPKELGFPEPEQLIDHYVDTMEQHVEKRVANCCKKSKKILTILCILHKISSYESKHWSGS